MHYITSGSLKSGYNLHAVSTSGWKGLKENRDDTDQHWSTMKFCNSDAKQTLHAPAVPVPKRDIEQ